MFGYNFVVVSLWMFVDLIAYSSYIMWFVCLLGLVAIGCGLFWLCWFVGFRSWVWVIDFQIGGVFRVLSWLLWFCFSVVW